MEVKLNLYVTLMCAAVIFLVGDFIVSRVKFLKKYCIPAPVLGGIIFAVITLILHQTGTMDISIDTSVQSLCMWLFFCSLGFGVQFKELAKGGVQLAVATVATGLLVIIQNAVGIGIISLFGEHPMIGACLGSIPLVGGHGTSAYFGVVLEEAGVHNAMTVGLAAATFGMIAGSLLGGPIAVARIKKNKLQYPGAVSYSEEISTTEEEHKPQKAFVPANFIYAIAILLLTLGISCLIKYATGQIAETINGIILGIIIRFLSDKYNWKLPVDEISTIGNSALVIFLGMSMMSLQLWLLGGNIGIAMIIILAIQTVIMAVFAYVIVFNLLGRDYEAAAMAAGFCGFGLGGTPNAIANMDALSKKYGPCPRAFLVVTTVGAMFVDMINLGVVTALMDYFC